MLLQFFRSESGAATVDWVILTAATVGMSLAVMDVVSGAVENLSNDIAAQLSSIQIRTTFEEWQDVRDQMAAAEAASAAAAQDEGG